VRSQGIEHVRTVTGCLLALTYSNEGTQHRARMTVDEETGIPCIEFDPPHSMTRPLTFVADAVEFFAGSLQFGGNRIGYQSGDCRHTSQFSELVVYALVGPPDEGDDDG
jgi:hypothetical protein